MFDSLDAMSLILNAVPMVCYLVIFAKLILKLHSLLQTFEAPIV
jgi:hypothetical protein